MATSFTGEVLREKVHQKLNCEKVKLWLPPYTTEDQQKGESPVQDLIDRYSTEIGASCEEMASILEDLRLHALEKLAVKQRFRSSGVASLKIKLAGNVPDSFRNSHPNLTMTLDLSLNISSHDLRMLIQEKSGIEAVKLKLIAAGHVLEDNQSLEEQGVTNMLTIMSLVLSESEAEAHKQEEQAASVAKTRKAAEYLSNFTNDNDDDDYYLQIADQTGKPIDLPNEERKALALAMTLHEKGRAAVKRKNYGEAILLLLEADREFKKCRADILNAVDNYALVCLDIVWCYLCLRNVNELPDAGVRLKACDDCFRRSYGPNLERLASVKGSTGEEQVLFMRLHLLQGILAYHQHQTTLASQLLNRASLELGRLQVDENQMTQVMEMGFSEQEARLGLRACDGQVQAAVTHIMKRREQKKELKDQEKEEKRQKRITKKLGKTANGEEVNVRHYESLLSMGFGGGAAATSLRQTNNDIMAALQVLQQHPELLDLPDPDPPEVKVTDELLSQVTAMGFAADQALAALHHFNANVGETIESLLTVGGIVPQTWLDAVPSTSSPNSGSGSPIKSPEEAALEKEAIDMIVPDLQGEQDHLDLGLEEEAKVLQEYMALMASLTDTS